jgi:hypothetical protein
MPVELVALTPGQVNARKTKLADHLDHFGDVRVTDLGERQSIRSIQWMVEAPGVPGVSDEVIGLYREVYVLDGTDWLISKYTYEYLDKIHNMRLAYHMHPLRAGGPLVAHAHCGVLDLSQLGGEEIDHNHFRAVEVDLREANDEFMTLYASGEPPPCNSMRPLTVPRS